MIKNQKTVVLFLFLPLFSLICLAVFKQSIRSGGREFTFPVSGYDPRDLLSGHYLVYRVDYQTSQNQCDAHSPAYVCLEPTRILSMGENPTCSAFIKGRCNERGSFEANIERFYVPELEAPQLDTAIRQGQGSIIVSVSSNGQAVVKEFLLNGLPWKQSIAPEASK